MKSRKEAVERANNARVNTPDTCQMWTRQIYDAPSVGDVDGDKAADAEDGWKSEPAEFKHTDRNPPAGVPVAYLGGSRDNGHRAISLGNGMIRSTDADGRGRVGTVPLNWPEKQWGLTYAGWSETISGHVIPHQEGPKNPPKPKPAPPTKPIDTTPNRETKVEHSRRLLKEALKTAEKNGNKGRAAELRSAIYELPDN